MPVGLFGATSRMPEIYTLQGNLLPKKNDLRVGKHGVFHDKKHKSNWDAFILQAQVLWSGKPQIASDTIVRTIFYRATKHRVDTTNLASALADILERAGVVVDDIFLHIWPDPVQHDKNNPRVEFWFQTPATQN